MTLKIVSWPYPCLKTKDKNVTKVTSEILQLWTDMIAVMEKMPGVGLAAPQLGIALSLAVVDASLERGKVIRMANPKVLHASQKIEVGKEASSNLAYVSSKIKRPRGITIRYLNELGVIQERDLVGFWARSTLHQIDHVHGRMYFDNLSKLKRGMLIKKAEKLCA